MNTYFSKNIRTSIALLLSLVPFRASAQGFSLEGSNFKGVICEIVSVLYLVIPILFGLALILFFWGLSKFILNSSGNEKEIATGKSYMMWGVVALFVLVSFRAIISMITGQFGFGDASVLPFLGQNGGRSVCESTSTNFIIDPNFKP